MSLRWISVILFSVLLVACGTHVRGVSKGTIFALDPINHAIRISAPSGNANIPGTINTFYVCPAEFDRLKIGQWFEMNRYLNNQGALCGINSR